MGNSTSVGVKGKPHGDGISVWYSAQQVDGTAITATLKAGSFVCWSYANFNGGTLGTTVTRPQSEIFKMFAGVVPDGHPDVTSAQWITILPTCSSATVLVDGGTNDIDIGDGLQLVDDQFYAEDAGSTATTDATVQIVVGTALSAQTAAAGAGITCSAIIGPAGRYC